MALWLFKQEPSCYPFEKFLKEGKTQWDGVRNNLALLNLRKVLPGDLAFFYHTGKEKSIVGVMKVVKVAKIDPKGKGEVPKIEVVPVKHLPRPVSLMEIKRNPALANWELLRLSRLSVVPVSPEQWRVIEEMGQENEDNGGGGKKEEC